MLLSPKEETLQRRWAEIRRTKKCQSPYWGAMDWCVRQGLMPKDTKPESPVTGLPDALFAPASSFTRREVYRAYKG